MNLQNNVPASIIPVNLIRPCVVQGVADTISMSIRIEIMEIIVPKRNNFYDNIFFLIFASIFAFFSDNADYSSQESESIH